MEETSANKEKFMKISNKLLNNSFLLKNKSREDYAFFEQNKHSFEEFFSKIGYEVKTFQTQGIVQLLNNFEQGNKLKLKKYQSILLLLLRRRFIEEKSKITEQSEVYITIGNLQDLYSGLYDNSKKTLDITRLRECLTLFKKYQLIDMNKSINSTNYIDDIAIEIHPTISLALIAEDFKDIIKETDNVLNSYLKGESQDEVDEN